MTVVLFDGTPSLRDPSVLYNPTPGAATYNPGVGSLDGSYAFGGFQAQNPKPLRSRFQLQRDVMRLWRDVLAAEATAGLIAHRCIFLSPSAACTTLNVWLGGPNGNSQPGSTATIAVGLDPAAVNVKAAVITAETAAPAGVAFSTPTSGAPLTMGAFTANQSRALWLRRTVGAGAAAFQDDFFEISYQADSGTVQTVAFWWHLLKGVKFSTVTPITHDNVGRVVTPQGGCVFTLNVVDAATGLTPTDPAQSTIWTAITCSTPSQGTAGVSGQTPVWGGSQPYQTERIVDQAQKTATGVYRYEFRPPGPGHYLLDFDMGDDTTRYSLWVSPA